MKYLSLIFLIALITINVFSQDDVISYLENVKRDFRKQDQIIPDSVISKYNIIFVGESHGIKCNYEIATKMLKEYKSKTDFTYLLAEIDLATSQRLNEAIFNEDTIELRNIVDQAKYSPAWCKENYQFYKSIVELNKLYQNKIEFIGTDITSGGVSNTVERLCAIKGKYNQKDSVLVSMLQIKRPSAEHIDYIKGLLSSINAEYRNEDLFEYKYHLNNIIYYYKAINTVSDIQWDKVRDSCMFVNYQKLEHQYSLRDEKMLAIGWGIEHVRQCESSGVNWFASSLKKNLNKNIYTYRIFYFDSKSMIPASWVPGLLKVFRSKNKRYYRVNFQNDDHWAVGYIPEVDKLKEVSPENSISIYNLNQTDSPFTLRPYLVANRNLDWTTTEFFQSAIVVRNSLATEPLGNNKK